MPVHVAHPLPDWPQGQQYLPKRKGTSTSHNTVVNGFCIPAASASFTADVYIGGNKQLASSIISCDQVPLETVIWRETETDTYHARFDRAWFLTLAHTGVRISELLDLRLGDLNLAAGYAIVRGGKPGKDRVVYLTPPLTHALKRYLQVRLDLPGNDHVFVLSRGSPATRTMQRRLARYGQQAGVQVSPHRLRHTLATRLINQGMPIHSLRKLLGHEHLNTTQIYARIYDETLYGQFKESISRLEAIPVEDWPGTEVDQKKWAEQQV